MSSTWWWVVVCALSVAVPVQAQEVPGGGGWAPAAGAAGDNTYQGFVDRPADGASFPLGASFHVSGWIVDTLAEGWAGIDDVQGIQWQYIVGAWLRGQRSTGRSGRYGQSVLGCLRI